MQRLFPRVVGVAALGFACEDDDTQLNTESLAAETPSGCRSDCTPRIGIVSAFGAEADRTRRWG